MSVTSSSFGVVYVLMRSRYVLPNHYLFMLAEQPPPDMAALLSTFQHVPLVVRKRAKELFDAIQDATRTPAEASAVPTPAAPAVVEEPMQVDEAPTEQPPAQETVAESSLWPSGASTAEF